VKLTAIGMRSLTTPGLYGDGNNLYLRVADTGKRAWVLRYSLRGKARVMGLGSAELVSLGEARQKAEAARKLLATGIDPLDQRAQARADAVIAESRAITFGQATERYLIAHEGGWTAPYRRKWRQTMRDFAFPVIEALPIEAIDTDQILQILEPIWQRKTVTASVLRGRLEAVLSYATARGWRNGPNPALWRGHLKMLLPAIGKVHTTVHFPALDWREASAFMAQLRGDTAVGSYALQFLILTAARSKEVLGATWAEIDAAAATWTIPQARMKTRVAHRVPLSAPALAVLETMQLLRQGDGLIFPGHRDQGRRRLNHQTPIYLLRRLGHGELTLHGFRSTFRDWAAEATGHPNHVVEQALAHTIGSAVEAAYRRGDLFAKRVALMDDWAAYLAQPAAQVVPLRAGRQGAGG
jgi:integrase